MKDIRKSLIEELDKHKNYFIDLYAFPYKNKFHMHDYKKKYYGTFSDYIHAIFAIFLPHTPGALISDDTYNGHSNKDLLLYKKKMDHVSNMIKELIKSFDGSHAYIEKLKNEHYGNDDISSFKISTNEWRGLSFSIIEAGNCCGMATIYNICNLKNISKELFFNFLKGANYSYYQYINAKSDSSYKVLEEYGFTEVESFDNRRGKKGLSILKYNLNETLKFKLTEEEKKLCAE